MPPVISVEHLSKSYRLGQINTGTFSYDLQLWWARMRGKPNPFWRIGDTDHGNRAGETLWALKDVSFRVEQGEVLGIIGRNGAGKSTLLKILSRVTAPTSGRIRVKGRIASLLEVGTGFHPELTGRENIYLNGAILGMKRDEITRKFDEIVDFAEIEKFIDTPVKRYSSGMYVRLAFAVAAHLEPEVLVIDEVLAVGDVAFQRKCLGKMNEVAGEGRTVLFVSHNMAAIQSLCHSCLWIDQGVIRDSGISSEIVQEYYDATISGNSSKKSLSDIPRRKDLSGFEFLSYKLLDVAGNEIDFARFCDALIIRIHGFAEKNIFGAVLAVNWFDENGYLLNRANTRSIAMDDLDLRQGDVDIDLEFRELALMPNLYRVSVALQDGDHGYYDWLDQAIEVNVRENPNHPVHFIFGQSNGTAWIPVTFRVHGT